MKKISSFVLVMALLLALAAPAMAQAPAENSLVMKQESIRGNRSFTQDSYPEIWITPIFDQHIIVGNEKYPPHFLRFAPPENTAMLDFSYDDATFIDHDVLLTYSYYAYDRASFELFLEKAAQEYTIADGSDGIAMYVNPESRRAHAMIDIKDKFEKSAKLQIIIDDHSRDIKPETLRELIEAEVERVTGTMEFVELDHYWSQGVVKSVELYSDRDPVKATVDTTGLTVTEVEEESLTTREKVDDRNSAATSFEIGTYAYVESKGDESKEYTMSDGTVWKIFNTEYHGYASMVVLEEGKYGTVYLTIEVDTAPEGFPAALEAAYARVTLEVE